MAKNDFVKPLDHRKSEIQRLIVSVNEFYKHDGDDVTYVHGIEVRTKTPVRIRLSSLEELSENNNKLKSTYFGNKTPEEQMDLVRGRRSRQSMERLSNNDSVGIRNAEFPDRGRILAFDKCRLKEDENLGKYMAFTADRVNEMSGELSAQVVHGLTTVKMQPYMKNGEKHLYASAIILDNAHRLQAPDSLKLEPAQAQTVAVQNLQALLSGLNNKSESQDVKMPFARLNIRNMETGKVQGSFPLLPSLETAKHEDVVQDHKPDTMQKYKGTSKEAEKTTVSYKVAADPQDSIADLLACKDYTSQQFIEKYGNNATFAQLESDTEMRSAYRNVLKQDVARIIVSSLIGAKSIPTVTTQQLNPHEHKSLRNLYAGLKNGNYTAELFSGQTINLGSRYTETFATKYLNDNAPQSSFRDITDTKVDFVRGKGIDGIEEPDRKPRGGNFHKLTYDFILNADDNALNLVTSYAKPVFTPAYVAVQPLSKLSTDNLIAVNIETQELARSHAMKQSLAMSDLTVEFVNEHKTNVYRPSNLNEFEYDKLENVKDLYLAQRQAAEVQREMSNDVEAPAVPSLNDTLQMQREKEKQSQNQVQHDDSPMHSI